MSHEETLLEIKGIMEILKGLREIIEDLEERVKRLVKSQEITIIGFDTNLWKVKILGSEKTTVQLTKSS